MSVILKSEVPAASERARERNCEDCGGKRAQLYEELRKVGEISVLMRRHLCRACARRRRRGEQKEAGSALRRTRAELMAELENFYSESGMLEICARCHDQGTGCCPSSCRSLTPSGCGQKTLWCSAFICGALLNAIAECDQETARRLKWLKSEVGPAEFRLFEIYSRTPAAEREEARPLVRAGSYPGSPGLAAAKDLRQRLLSLMEEVLEVRRAWRASEEVEFREPDGG